MIAKILLASLAALFLYTSCVEACFKGVCYRNCIKNKANNATICNNRCCAG